VIRRQMNAPRRRAVAPFYGTEAATARVVRNTRAARRRDGVRVAEERIAGVASAASAQPATPGGEDAHARFSPTLLCHAVAARSAGIREVQQTMARRSNAYVVAGIENWSMSVLDKSVRGGIVTGSRSRPGSDHAQSPPSTAVVVREWWRKNRVAINAA